MTHSTQSLSTRFSAVAAVATATLATDAQAGETTAHHEPAYIVQYVKFESSLSREEVLAAAEERLPRFQAMEGLVQKYYLEMEEPNTYGGMYIWKDKASMAAFLQSDFFKSIPKAYGISEQPKVEIIPVLYPLR